MRRHSRSNEGYDDSTLSGGSRWLGGWVTGLSTGTRARRRVGGYPGHCHRKRDYQASSQLQHLARGERNGHLSSECGRASCHKTDPSPTHSFFKTLIDHEVTVELKNDIQIRGTLKSVDQYLNIKLDDISVVDDLKYPHLVRDSPSISIPTPAQPAPLPLLSSSLRQE